jgi:N-methylhydantoinase A/oxoprolinase/acetone carboxylase beta subunit
MIIGLDVGGTHTDVVLLGNEGVLDEFKVPTDPDDLFSTVLSGLDAITRGVDLDKIARVVMSTTLTTNAIVQSKLPTVGVIVSGGPGIDPEFFRTNDHYYPVSGSIDHRGRIVSPVRSDEIAALRDRLIRDGIRHVGVVTKFSVRNPDQEVEIANILGDRFEKVFLGHRISGNLSFPRRIATTFLNTAVYPIHRTFFQAVKKSLEQKGLRVPFRILKADGGNMNFEASIDHPAQTILSGPAASVMGSIAFAPEEEEALVMDIGGTTTDMAILASQVPLLDPTGVELGGYKTLIRALQTLSIGIGGDSAVRMDGGRLTVGPERLGRAMVHGGPAPTPTDALAIMGRIKGLDAARSREGYAPIAAQLGLSVEETAARVFDLTCRSILDAADAMIARLNSKPVYTVHEMWKGKRIAPKTILVLGGPAHLFAEHLERLSPYRVGAVPRWQVANAIGAALARTTSEVVLYADTERRIAFAPQEDFIKEIDSGFTREMAVEMAFERLREKSLARGANPDHLDMEVIENLQFNMVRGFRTTGRNIRVCVQVKPGLIHGYDPVAGRLL